MIDAMKILLLVVCAMLLVNWGFGYRAAYDISYGAFALMAAMVSLTFLWLWIKRASPLAGGMAFSWAGSASVIGWWWVYNLLSAPELMRESAALFICLGVYFVGAIMHFSVIGQTLGLPRWGWIFPVVLSIAVSMALNIS